MKSSSLNKRNKTLDVVKCFAIFLVLWGHSIQHLGSTPYYENPIYRIIYSFHMPLFMILVGFFATPLLSLKLKDVIKKKTVQLIIPALVFGLVIVMSLFLVGADIGLISRVFSSVFQN